MHKPFLSGLVSVVVFFVVILIFGAKDSHAATYTAERCSGTGIIFKEYDLPGNTRSDGTADGKAFAGRSDTPEPHVTLTLTDRGQATIPVYVTYYNLTSGAYVQYSPYTVPVVSCGAAGSGTSNAQAAGTPPPASTPEIQGELESAAGGEPAFPSCPAGSTKLKDFGPYEMYNKQQPTWPVYNLVDVTFDNTSGFTGGKVIVWQGEGHNWDLGCKGGPANDLNGVPSWSCDDVEKNEIASFTINGTKIGEFTDHNPDDDRNFLYSFNTSNLISGSNTLKIQHIYPDRTDVPQSYVYVKGVVCANTGTTSVSPSVSAAPTATGTVVSPTNTASGWAACNKNTLNVPNCRTQAKAYKGAASTFVPGNGSDQAWYDWAKSEPQAVSNDTACGIGAWAVPACGGAPATDTPIPCPEKPKGDANCDGKITLADFEFWRRDFTQNTVTSGGDFDGNGKAELSDFEKWRTNMFLT